MRIRKVDANQSKLVEQMRQIPGVGVKHTHMVGDGFGDVVIGFRGVNYLFEIKDPDKPPSARKLTPDEQRFHDEWPGSIHIVEKIEDVFRILNLK